MSDSITIENSDGETFAEVIDVVGVSEIKKAFHKSIKEGSLHKWFKGSKSKDGKPGWVNVVTGGTCASDKPGEGTPKCVSSSKRASMTKAERLSAARRKKKADPGQQAKSGAAKPTYVSTDKPKKKMSEEMKRDEYGDPMGGPKISKKQMKKNLMKNEPDEQHNTRMGESMEITEADKKGKGSGSKDACYHKVKSRYSVWPSAYASGALVKCRKVGAANWGNSTKKEEYIPEEGYDVARDMGRVRPSKDKKDATSYPPSEEMKKLRKINKGPSALDRVKKKYKGQIMDVKKEEVELDEKCWKGYEKKGMKTMFGKRYPNCVKKEEYSDWRDEIEYVDEAASKAITLGIKGAVAGGKAVAKKLSRKAVRAGIKVGGKQGGKAVKKAGKVAATETKKAAAETAGAVGAGAAKGIKKRKEKFVAKVKRKSEEMFSGEGKKKPQNVNENRNNPKKKTKNNFLGGKPGDGYIGNPKLKIKNPLNTIKKTVDDTAKSAGSTAGTEIGNTAGPKIQKSIELGAKNATDTAVAGSEKISKNLSKGLSKGVGKAALYTGAAVVGTKLANKAIDRVLPDKKKKKKKKVNENKLVEYNWSDPLALQAGSEAIKGATDHAVKGAAKIAGIGAGAYLGSKVIGKAIDGKKKKKTKKEEYSDWRSSLTEDDMKGMSVKSGHKRPTKSGAGMTQKGVEAYRRRNPGSKLKTAVTTEPSKLKKGSKAANRRKSYCARSAGQMKKFPKAAKDPNSRLRQARKRWNC